MKSIFRVLIFALVLFSKSEAQNNWKVQYPYLDVNYINTFFLNDQVGWADIYLDSKNGTNDIFLYKTIDGGENWIQIYSFDPTFKLWGKVQFINESVGFISVGTDESRYIYKSTDGGYSWNILPSEPYAKKFLFLNENLGFVHSQGPPSKVKRTSNGGGSWNIVYTLANSAYVKHFFFTNEMNGWMVGSDTWSDNMYKTTNSGLFWESTGYNQEDRIGMTEFFNENDGYMMSNKKRVLRSSDGGLNWLSVYYNSSLTQLNWFDAKNLDTVYVVGKAGHLTPVILRTTNGQQWDVTLFNSYSEFYSINLFNHDTIYIPARGLGNLGGSAHLKVVGSNYQIKEYGLGLKHKMVGVYSTEQNRIAIGYKFNQNISEYESLILQGPPEWNVMRILPNEKLTTLFFKDSLSGFVGGNRYISSEETFIYHTSDMGESFETVFTRTGNININAIIFKDELTGYAIGDQGFIVKSTDGGMNWEQILSFTTENLNSINFYSDLGFICCSNGKIFKTTDGGNTWAEKNVGSGKKLNCVAIKDSNEIFVVGEQGSLFKSDDQGENWHNFSFNEDYNFNFVKFYPDSNGRVYGGKISDNSTVIFESHNGGVTWDEHSFQLTKSINYVFIKDQPFEEWSVGDEGTILYNNYQHFPPPPIPVELFSFFGEMIDEKVILNWSTASELNSLGFEIERSANRVDWRLIGFKEGGGTTTETHNYSFVDDLFGINTLRLYYRLKQIDYDGSYEYSDIVEVEIVPSTFSLSQNYPNPFNSSSIIKYSLPKLSQVTIKIFSSLGEEIIVLVNEEKSAGYYEVEFDATNLPSGIYFYQLKTTDFTQTKKMILLK